jgi:hypothetical protein
VKFLFALKLLAGADDDEWNNNAYLPNTDLLTQSLIRASPKHINLLGVYLSVHL